VSTARLRGCIKLAGFAVVTGVLYPTHVLTVPPLRWLGLAADRWSARLFRAWARGVARTAGMRVEVEGTPPQPPFFLVSNHLSYVDVLVLASQVDGVFVARADVSRWPVFGALCRAVGTIFIDRERKRDLTQVLGRIDSVLGKDRGVVLFPEGTSSAGERVLRFRPSLLDTAARLEIPVSFASISYETPPGAAPARTAVCWWGGMTFLRHVVNLFGLPGFRARVRFGDGTICESDRKVLAARLWRAVGDQFQPTSVGVPREGVSDTLMAGSGPPGIEPAAPAMEYPPLACVAPGSEPPPSGRRGES
jgi:1-acyl-sn-glycerol-3-phosphate acyltransferase